MRSTITAIVFSLITVICATPIISAEENPSKSPIPSKSMENSDDTAVSNTPDKSQLTSTQIAPCDSKANQVHAQANDSEEINKQLHLYVAIWLGILALSCVLHWTRVITVFKDYNDLGLTFLLPASIAAIVLISGGAFAAPSQKGEINPVAIAIAVIEAVLFFYISFITLKTNKWNPLWFVLALITKLSFSFLFVVSFLQFISPTGKNLQQRAQSRRSALAILLVVVPLTCSLVREKTGAFNPERTLRQ